MIQGVIGGTYIKENSTVKVSTADLFDKIINIKFMRKYGKSFTLRSDYEPVHHRDGTVSFKRCTQKPDVKVEYKLVSNSVAIEVDIRVTNLFIGDEVIDPDEPNKNRRIDTALGDPVERCIIQMGYIGQFTDWTKKIITDENIGEFWDLSYDKQSRNNQLDVQILTGYNESYPPDKVTYFKGIIGTLEIGLRWNADLKALVESYGDRNFPDEFLEMERVLYTLITRRFIKPSIRCRAETIRDFTNQEALEDVQNKGFEQRVLIYQYDKYKDPGIKPLNRMQPLEVTEESNVVTSVTKEDSDEWKELPVTKEGIMSFEEANKFGVICAVSETLRTMPENALYGYKGQWKKQPTPFNDLQNTIGAQLVAIQQHYPFLRWYELIDGSFYFYHVEDTDEDLFKDGFVKGLQKENKVFLPAIYDMTPSGTRTIRCPFVTCISSMVKVHFETRHDIGTLVSYFYPVQTNTFLVIIADVKFATVQEDNVMELMCVDMPREKLTIDPFSDQVITDDSTIETELGKGTGTSEKQEYRNRWVQKELTVVPYQKFANIVHKDILSDINPDGWEEGELPNDPIERERLALDYLAEWNPDLFDPDGEYMTRSKAAHGESVENWLSGIGGRTGKKVPWLHVGDKIVIKSPFQSKYPKDEEWRQV